VAEILSQLEIDALLNALQTGEVDAETIKQKESEKKIRIYDFRRPNKFSKEQLNTIEVISENYCRLITTYLSGQLRTRVQIKVASVEQLTYEEFIRSIPNPTILNIFGLLPFEGKGILEINPNLVFYIIDRLFGGPGTANMSGRPLTEIEQNVVAKTVTKLLDYFKDAWANLVELKNASVIGPTGFSQVNSGVLYLPLPSKSTKPGGFIVSILLSFMYSHIPAVLLCPLLNPGSTRFISSPKKSPFSVSHKLPVTGSKSIPNEFLIPYAK